MTWEQMMHQCFTDDGMAAVCFCIRGEDHNEAEFDVSRAVQGGEDEKEAR